MEENNDIMSEAEYVLYNIFNYMVGNNIMNTYVTSIDDENEITIIIKSKQSQKMMLDHLEKPLKICKGDKITDEMCNICFSNYKENEYKRVLKKCGHYFHKKCIDKWFCKNKDNMNCPICRENYNKKINYTGLF